jgi:predicted nucleic acid-binding protein
MARIVFLDSGPLGLVSNRPGKPRVDRCAVWLNDLLTAGVRVVVPEIADYEVRRELLRVGARAGLRRLAALESTLLYAEITTAVMHQAARFWAEVRQRGLPTSDPKALDADAILAAQAHLAGGPGDTVIVATDNVGHLGQFVDARPWPTIT